MFYVIEKIVRATFQALSFIFMARFLSPEFLGYIAVVSSIIALLSLVSVFGLDQMVIRATAKSFASGRGAAFRGAFLSISIGSILASSLLCVALFTAPSFERDAIILLSVSIPMASAAIIQAYLMASRRNKWLSFVLLFEVGVISATRILLSLYGADPFAFIALIFVDNLLVFAISIGAFCRNLNKPFRARGGKKLYRVMLTSSAPLALSVVVAFVYMRVDQIMVRFLDGAETVGTYLVALRVIDILSLIVTTVLRNYSASVLKLFSSDPEEFYFRLERLLSLVIGATILTYLLVYFKGDEAITAIFGPDYLGASDILQILILTMPAILIGQFSFLTSISGGSFSMPLIRSILGLLVNIGANWLLIPIFGGVGAAVGTLIAFWCSAVLSLAFRREDRRIFLTVLRSTACTWAYR